MTFNTKFNIDQIITYLNDKWKVEGISCSSNKITNNIIQVTYVIRNVRNSKVTKLVYEGDLRI